MKKLILLLTCLPLLAADTTLIPALKPITFAWDHEREDDSIIYDLIINESTVLKSWQTNEIMITGTRTNVYQWTNVLGAVFTGTNIISQIEAVYQPGFVRGTNSITVKAKNQFESGDPSNILPLKALGKPAAPSALRKP